MENVLTRGRSLAGEAPRQAVNSSRYRGLDRPASNDATGGLPQFPATASSCGGTQWNRSPHGLWKYRPLALVRSGTSSFPFSAVSVLPASYSHGLPRWQRLHRLSAGSAGSTCPRPTPEGVPWHLPMPSRIETARRRVGQDQAVVGASEHQHTERGVAQLACLDQLAVGRRTHQVLLTPHPLPRCLRITGIRTVVSFVSTAMAYPPPAGPGSRYGSTGLRQSNPALRSDHQIDLPDLLCAMSIVTGAAALKTACSRTSSTIRVNASHNCAAT